MKLLLNIIFLLFLFCLFACGPRSGVHNDPPAENPYAGTDTSSPRFKEDLKRSEIFDKGKKLFKQNCAVCHAGRSDQMFTGPGLKGLAERLPEPAEEWFTKYTLNSDSMYRSGDKYARKLRAEFKDVEMTVFSGHLSTEEVKKIYYYLTAPPQHNGCVIE